MCSSIVYFTDSHFILQFFYKAPIVCVYIHHNMINTKSIISLTNIVNVCTSTLPAAPYPHRYSKFLSDFRSLSLWQTGALQLFPPPPNVWSSILLHLFSLGLFCLGLHWDVQSLFLNSKQVLKSMLYNVQKRTGDWIYIDWEILHKLHAIVCKVFKIYYTLL